MVEKIDFKKTLKTLYAPTNRDFHEVEVPTMQFVKLDGKGDPNAESEYGAGLRWLYGISYAMKFASKLTLKRDYVVSPLEALWWADDMEVFLTRAKSEWQWTQLLMVPDWIGEDIYQAALAKTADKLGERPPAALSFEAFAEGLSVQVLHVGSYDDEAPTIRRLHKEYLPERGLTENGLHHEIYLSDPRMVGPEKLKTVIRQPVRRL